MDMIGPLRSRLALADRAAEVVAPLVEGWDGQVPAIPTAAYAPVDEAAYVYRQRRDRTEHIGLILEVRRSFVDAGRLRGHEAVFPERVASLAQRLEHGEPRTSLVSALVDAGPAYRSHVRRVVADAPALQVTTADGGEHTLWRVSDDVLPAVTAELSDSVLYVADGHHRLAATQRFWASDAGCLAAGLPVVVYPLDGLRLEPFHRVLPGPLPADGRERLRLALAAAYDLVPVDRVPAVRSGQLAVYDDRRWLLATSRQTGLTGLTGVAGLDAVLLEQHVLTPAGVGRARPVRAPLAELARRCDEDGGVLFGLAPPALSTLTGIADRGEVMPAKTTSFQPKPVSGLLLSA